MKNFGSVPQTVVRELNDRHTDGTHYFYAIYFYDPLFLCYRRAKSVKVSGPSASHLMLTVLQHSWRDLFMCDTVYIRRCNVKSHRKVQGRNSTPE